MCLSIDVDLRLVGPSHLLLDITIYNLDHEVHTPFLRFFRQLNVRGDKLVLANYIVAQVTSIITGDIYYILDHHYSNSPKRISDTIAAYFRERRTRPIIQIFINPPTSPQQVPISSLTHSTNSEPLQDRQVY
jgi:hypothetical protein